MENTHPFLKWQTTWLVYIRSDMVSTWKYFLHANIQRRFFSYNYLITPLPGSRYRREGKNNVRNVVVFNKN